MTIYFPLGLDRQNEVVTSCRIPNCIEFGTIKIWVVQHLPFTEIFNSTLQAHPSEYYVLLHLTVSHIGQ